MIRPIMLHQAHGVAMLARVAVPHPSHEQTAWFVALVVGFCAAHLGSVFTRLHAPAWVKASVTWLIGTAAGVIPTIYWAPSADWTKYVEAIFIAVGGQLIAHYTGATNPTARLTAAFGATGPGRPTNLTMAGRGVPALAQTGAVT